MSAKEKSEVWRGFVVMKCSEVPPGSIVIPYVGVTDDLRRRVFEKRSLLCWWFVVGVAARFSEALYVIEHCPAMKSVRVGLRICNEEVMVLIPCD